VCNLFFAPMLAAENQAQLYRLYAEEPPTWRFDPDGRNFRITQPDIDTEHLDLKTLERYVPPEKRDSTRMENATEYSKAHEDLMNANRYHRAVVGVWLSQFVTLLAFLTAALAGGLAADHLCRSGRGAVARVLCYAEVYGTTLLTLPAVALLATVLKVASEGAKHINPPPVGPFVGFLVGAVVMAAVAWAGVVRRWHPLVRAGVYLTVVGTLAAVTVWQVERTRVEWAQRAEDRRVEKARLAATTPLQHGVSTGPDFTAYDIAWPGGLRVLVVCDGWIQYSGRAFPELCEVNATSADRQSKFTFRVVTADGRVGRLQFADGEYDCGTGAVFVIRTGGGRTEVRRLPRDVTTVKDGLSLAEDQQVRKALRGE
jgi:hypothetical protein